MKIENDLRIKVRDSKQRREFVDPPRFSQTANPNAIDGHTKATLCLYLFDTCALDSRV